MPTSDSVSRQMLRAHHVRNINRVEVGAENLAAVRAFFAAHLCATQRECASALGLSVMAVNRHVAVIRAEWREAVTP